MWWRSGEKPIGESGCMAGPGCAVHTVTGNRLASNVVVVVVSTKLVSTAATHAQLSLRPSARRGQRARYSRTQAPPWGRTFPCYSTLLPLFSLLLLPFCLIPLCFFPMHPPYPATGISAFSALYLSSVQPQSVLKIVWRSSSPPNVFSTF